MMTFQSQINLPGLAQGQVIYIVVDAFDEFEGGDFLLNIDML